MKEDAYIREILMGAKACRSAREMTAARAIWQEARRQAIEECAVIAEGMAYTGGWGVAIAEMLRALLSPSPASAPEGGDG